MEAEVGGSNPSTRTIINTTKTKNMDVYKEAVKQRVRFNTSKGPLTTEQLWDLTLAELDALAVKLEKDYESSKGKSFLAKKTVKDKSLKLQFDVVLDVLETKNEELEIANKRRETKERNQKILGIIQKKKDEALEGKTLSQLEKMLEEEEA